MKVLPMLTRRFYSNIEHCRLEAEISDETGAVIAILYEDRAGWHVEHFGTEPHFSVDLADEFVAEVKADLTRYVNRTGHDPPDGLTRAGLALWLMKKDDGTAMGLAI